MLFLLLLLKRRNKITVYYMCSIERDHIRSKQFRKFFCLALQGWRSGESTRLLPMWPGFNSRSQRHMCHMWSRCHMWVEFVVGSFLASLGFSPGTPVFPPPQKPTLPNSNSIRNARTHVERAPERSVGKQIPSFASILRAKFSANQSQ